MATFKAAHINEQGVNLIIIPLELSFGSKSPAEKNELIEALQHSASDAGLAGTIVPAWFSGNTRAWICPPRWNPFFESFDWDNLSHNLNVELHSD